MKTDDYRRERIERLLKELEYEVVRGMLEGEVDEEMGFDFVVPRSRKIPDGIVQCSFRTRPMPYYLARADKPSLRLIGGDKK